MAEQKQDKASQSPLISVIMPVYNAQAYVKEAVFSILEQSFTDFEVIIVDDGSTDASGRILADIARQDSRIHLYSRTNHGLISSLNFALDKARGQYLARMDADDVSTPQRLQQQLQFLQQHPDIAVLGTGYVYIDQHGHRLGKRHTCMYHDDIVASFFFGNPIAHPSVMVNRRLLRQPLNYEADYIGAEDFQLWLRLSQQVRFANLPEPLLYYRLSGQSHSDHLQQVQRDSAIRAISKFTFLKLSPDPESLAQALFNSAGAWRDYPQFLFACIKLNLFNIKASGVSAWALLKRTLIAQRSYFRRRLRASTMTEERRIE
ncbi:glycosyltransferase family 2 protein [Thalassotalea mangrovi]|nr:glycosyltransferase [Thalassotalea mangrovi]